MDVYCNEKRVGMLRASESQWQLQFHHTAPVPLSPRFTSRKGEIVDGDDVRNFFVNLLPEDPFAQRVAANLYPRPTNFEDWLNALGQEFTGAYAVVPNGARLAPVRYLDLSASHFLESMRESRSRADAMTFNVNNQNSQPRLSLAGAQDKFALWFDPSARQADHRFKIPQGRAASTHVFKPASTDARYPMLPANEFACAQLAKAIGLTVANSDVLTFGGVRTLVSERFDRVRRGLRVDRIHQIDLCQMLNVSREQKYGSHNTGVDTEHFFAACAQLRVPALARQVHLRAWLFNFVIGNQDAHAKNYSFLYNDGWRCAPLYDLLCVLPYLPNQSLSMGLLDEYRPGWFEREHWSNLAYLAGVTKSYLSQEMQRMVEAVQSAANPLEKMLREKLTDEELDFLSQKVNPFIQERTQWLKSAATYF